MSALPGTRARQALAADLVRRCAAGDQEAIAQLFEMFGTLVLHITSRIVHSPEKAEEIRQEVFLYAWRRAADYDPRRGQVSTWLTRIARSRAIDALRRTSTRRRARERAARETPRSEQATSEREVFLTEIRPRLRRALSALPAPQRRAIVLAYYGGMTQREIAAHSRTPIGTIKTRTLLGLQKLRRQLGQESLGVESVSP